MEKVTKPTTETERVCKTCNKTKAISCFGRKKVYNGKEYRSYDCSACQSRQYRSNPERRQRCRDTQKRCRAKYDKDTIRKQLFQHIGQDRCFHCGITDVRVLHFHHRDPSTKEFNIKWGFTHYMPLKSLIPEAEKCDILCSNCHLKVHKGNSKPAQYRLRKKVELLTTVGQTKCLYCGNDDPECLVFHHKRDKQFIISARLHRPVEELLDEAMKCDVLCCNCHMIVHANLLFYAR